MIRLLQVLPVIVFFSSAISVLYYLRIMPVVINKIAWLMHVTMKTSGSESLNAAGNIFIGQVYSSLQWLLTKQQQLVCNSGHILSFPDRSSSHGSTILGNNDKV
jgi:nucleoside permease NupC